MDSSKIPFPPPMTVALSNYLAHHPSTGPVSAEVHTEALLLGLAGRRLTYAHREVVDHLAHNEPGSCRELVEQLVHVDPRRRETAWGVIDDRARAVRGLTVLRDRREPVL